MHALQQNTSNCLCVQCCAIRSSVCWCLECVAWCTHGSRAGHVTSGAARTRRAIEPGPTVECCAHPSPCCRLNPPRPIPPPTPPHGSYARDVIPGRHTLGCVRRYIVSLNVDKLRNGFQIILPSHFQYQLLILFPVHVDICLIEMSIKINFL